MSTIRNILVYLVLEDDPSFFITIILFLLLKRVLQECPLKYSDSSANRHCGCSAYHECEPILCNTSGCVDKLDTTITRF